MKNDEYLNTIRSMAFQSPPTAFLARLKNFNTIYDLQLVRNSGPLPWPTLDEIVAFGDRPIAGEDKDLLSLYVNSFFLANELIDIAVYFYDKYGLKLCDIRALEFPLPLPFSISYQDFEGSTGLEDVTIGDPGVLPPLSLLALYFDVAGNSAAWRESSFGDFFTWAERHGSGVQSFVITAGEVIKDEEIRGYGVPGGKCFLDQLTGVHVREVRETIEP